MEEIAIVGNLKNFIIINRDCIKIEDEYLVDLSDSVDKNSVFCLNESVPDSGKLVFRSREEMEDRKYFVRSNEGDPELLFYIPFNSVVNLKSMIMIGGEDGTAPLHVKLYTNITSPDFSLVET
ncbi:MAG: PITH domain-containing protein, partial [bacterium]